MVPKKEVSSSRVDRSARARLSTRQTITTGQVKHIAKLARLELTKKETVKMQKDLSVILDYFDLLKKAPYTKNFTEKFGVITNAQHLRKDEVSPGKRDLVEKLIGAFPSKKDDYIRVKTIL